MTISSPTFDIINPIFLPGSSPESLLSNGSMVGISILAKSPLLSTSGSWQLVSFLASLPNPSVIFLGDKLNRHNIKAMCNMKRRAVISDEKALETALKSGEEYHKFLSGAIHYLEATQIDKVGKVTLLRWDDIEGHEMKLHQQIVRRHYETNDLLKEKIGKYLSLKHVLSIFRNFP